MQLLIDQAKIQMLQLAEAVVEQVALRFDQFRTSVYVVLEFHWGWLVV